MRKGKQFGNRKKNVGWKNLGMEVKNSDCIKIGGDRKKNLMAFIFILFL